MLLFSCVLQDLTWVWLSVSHQSTYRDSRPRAICCCVAAERHSQCQVEVSFVWMELESRPCRSALHVHDCHRTADACYVVKVVTATVLLRYKMFRFSSIIVLSFCSKNPICYCHCGMWAWMGMALGIGKMFVGMRRLWGWLPLRRVMPMSRAEQSRNWTSNN